jgi:hypothetical protein
LRDAFDHVTTQWDARQHYVMSAALYHSGTMLKASRTAEQEVRLTVAAAVQAQTIELRTRYSTFDHVCVVIHDTARS